MSATALPPFVPHPLLAGFHRQTLAAALLGGRAAGARPRILRVDARNAVLALEHAGPSPSAPVLLLLHGLAGSADSPYMRRSARKAVARGFRVLRLNARNCGGSEALCETLYHGGLHEDPLEVARQLAAEGAPCVFVAGFSLGGNLALRLAAACGREAPWLAGVASVSGALDLGACARRLDDAPGLAPYRRLFVRGLARVLRRRARREPGRRDLTGLGRVRTFRELDGRWTGPEFGFSGAEDYWARASSLPQLPRVAVPALLLASHDDAFVPAEVHEAAVAVAPPGLRVALTARGGHCGFLGAGLRRPGGARDPDCFWAENRVLDFAAQACAAALSRPRP